MNSATPCRPLSAPRPSISLRTAGSAARRWPSAMRIDEAGRRHDLEALVDADQKFRRNDQALDRAELHAFDLPLRRAQLARRIDLDLDAAAGILLDRGRVILGELRARHRRRSPARSSSRRACRPPPARRTTCRKRQDEGGTAQARLTISRRVIEHRSPPGRSPDTYGGSRAGARRPDYWLGVCRCPRRRVGHDLIGVRRAAGSISTRPRRRWTSVFIIAACSSGGSLISSPPLAVQSLPPICLRDVDRDRIDRDGLLGGVLVDDLLQIRGQRVVPFLVDLDDDENRRLIGHRHVFRRVDEVHVRERVPCR